MSRLGGSHKQPGKKCGTLAKKCPSIIHFPLLTHTKIKEKEKQGERSYYRGPSKQKNITVKDKEKKRSTWFKGKDGKSNFKSVMFVDSSENDELVRILKETEDKHRVSDDIRIKIVSKSGTKLKDIFVKKDPFAENCDKRDCMVCSKNGGSKHMKCRKQNVTYESKCVTCEKEEKSV